MNNLVYREALHLGPDSEEGNSARHSRDVVLIERSSLELLKVEDAKASELTRFEFPYCSNNKNWSTAVTEIIKRQTLQSERSENTEFWVLDSQMMLIPEALFQKDKVHEYFKNTFNTSADSEYSVDHIPTGDMVMANSVPKDLCQTLGTTPQNAFLPWLSRQISTTNNSSKVAILIKQNHFNVTVFKSGELVLCNWFSFEKPEDVLYFILATLESLKILHTEASFTLSGEIEKGDSLYNSLLKFIGKVEFMERPKGLDYSYSFSKEPAHKHSLILSAACA